MFIICKIRATASRRTKNPCLLTWLWPPSVCPLITVFTRRLQTSEGSMAQINILIQNPGLMVLCFISTHYAAAILCQILLSCVCLCMCVCVRAPFDKRHDGGISSCCLKLIKSSLLDRVIRILHHFRVRFCIITIVIGLLAVCPHLHKQVCTEMQPFSIF